MESSARYQGQKRLQNYHPPDPTILKRSCPPTSSLGASSSKIVTPGSVKTYGAEAEFKLPENQPTNNENKSPLQPRPHPLFGASAPQPSRMSSSSTSLGVPCTVFKIGSNSKDFATFLERWRQVPRFAFSLVYIPRPGRTSIAVPSSSFALKANLQQESDHQDPATLRLGSIHSVMAPGILAEEDMVYFAESQKLVGIVVTWEEARCYVVNLSLARASSAVEEQKRRAEKKERLLKIKELLERSDNEKILYDSKPQIKILLTANIFLIHGLRDPRIAAWILDPDMAKDSSLSQLMEKYLDLPTIKNDWNQMEVKKDIPLSTSEHLKIAVTRALRIAYSSLIVMEAIDKELRLNSQYNLFVDMEMKLLPILAKMEYYGVGFSKPSLLQARELVEAKVANLKSRAFKIARQEFDLDSPMEVSFILFDHLNLPYPSLTHGKDGFAASMLKQEAAKPVANPKTFSTEAGSSKNILSAAPMRTKRVEKSTKAEVLHAMMALPNPNPLPAIILEHRMLTHTLNNYMDPLPTFSFHSQKLNMTRIYSTCHQTCVPTGRLAFDHPNLQSIRHAFEFVPLTSKSTLPNTSANKTTDGSTSTESPHTPLGSPIEVNIRDAFIAAPNMTLVSFDYCQLELRIMAHFAQDEKLLAQLSDPTVDMFNVIAGTWLCKSPSDVTPDERVQAKHICYGILYGMGIVALSRVLKVSRSEAKKFRSNFESRFSGLTRFLAQAVTKTREKGYSETLGGRRRHFPQIYSVGKGKEERTEYARAVRQITNTVCQGSAADIVKLATIKIEELLRVQAPEGRCIINLHDELVYELPTRHLDVLIPQMRSILETIMILRLPLPVRIFFGQTWGHLASWMPGASITAEMTAGPPV